MSDDNYKPDPAMGAIFDAFELGQKSVKKEFQWKSDKYNEHGYGHVYLDGSPMFRRDSIIDLKRKIEDLKSGEIPKGDTDEVTRSYLDIVIDFIDEMLEPKKT